MDSLRSGVRTSSGEESLLMPDLTRATEPMLIRPVLSNGDLALLPPIPPGFRGGLAAILFACPIRCFTLSQNVEKREKKWRVCDILLKGRHDEGRRRRACQFLL